jgi:DNA repair exonuclease SbcCD ATPase subunit
VALARASARAERDAAAEAARALGLPADADEIDRRADAIAAGIRAAREAAAWDTHRADLDGRRARAEATLRDALAARGAGIETDTRAAMASYEAACRRRAEQARRAGGRAALERALETRRAAEAAALETSRSTERAEHALRAVAAEIGLEPERPAGELAEALAAWRREQGAQAQRADAARGEWHELTTLLDGRTLDQLRAEAEAAAARAATLAARVDRAQLAELASRDDLPSLLEVERDELRRVSAEASSQRGALAEIQRDLPDVTEAEEALAEASAELERVIGLQEVLERTAGLLRAAEERVHRDLAPVLSREITRWLPRVTMGAYTEATVDPADLSIRVKHSATGQWRPPPAQHRSQPSVELLSEGTGEQIYLLLRVAMAQYLVTTGETAPLLLDEVTVQADAERKQQLLGVLHELSAERQIILFTHDDDVVDWAASTLSAPRDRLVELRAGAPHAAVG